MTDAIRVRTERLDLQPIPPAAAAALPDDRATAEAELGCTMPPAWPHAALLGILAPQAAARDGEERFGAWCIVERASAIVIGDIGFHGPPDADGLVEVGYRIEPAWRQRGMAGEALAGLLEWVSGDAGVTGVIACCDPGNVASIRLLETHGFRRAGERGDELRWLR